MTEMQTESLEWRVHTPGLIKEIALNPQAQSLRIPLNILQGLLAQVAERAIQLKDERLNALMMRLTLYSQADPESPDYDPDLVKRILG